jgi:hypothetical protein
MVNNEFGYIRSGPGRGRDLIFIHFVIILSSMNQEWEQWGGEEEGWGECTQKENKNKETISQCKPG